MADGADKIEAGEKIGVLPKVYAAAPSSLSFKKLRKRLLRQTQEAIRRFAMETPRTDGAPPKRLVCLSGGKDSYTLLAALIDLKWQGAIRAELLVCNLDQGQPEYPKHILSNYLSAIGVNHRILTEDTYSIVTEIVPDTKTYCALCSRLRRGILYRAAREEGCDAIVLGHHRDDVLETFMMNFFHGGRLAAMPPSSSMTRATFWSCGRLFCALKATLQNLRRQWRFRSFPAIFAVRNEACSAC